MPGPIVRRVEVTDEKYRAAPGEGAAHFSSRLCGSFYPASLAGFRRLIKERAQSAQFSPDQPGDRHCCERNYYEGHSQSC
jgi:hypothetical protein